MELDLVNSFHVKGIINCVGKILKIVSDVDYFNIGLDIVSYILQAVSVLKMSVLIVWEEIVTLHVDKQVRCVISSCRDNYSHYSYIVEDFCLRKIDESSRKGGFGI